MFRILFTFTHTRNGQCVWGYLLSNERYHVTAFYDFFWLTFPWIFNEIGNYRFLNIDIDGERERRGTLLIFKKSCLFNSVGKIRYPYAKK